MSFPEIYLSPLPCGKGDNEPALTVFSDGVGQDSTFLLLKFINDPDFRKKYAPNRLIVLFADTNSEHSFTYDYLKEVHIPLCEKHGIEFHIIKPEMGFHSEAWQSLVGQWSRGKPTIGSVAFNSSACTHNLKLEPQYRFIEKLLTDQYGMPFGRKKGYNEFAKQHGKIRWLVGIAKGEESRVMNPEDEKKVWKRNSLDMAYPLIDIGVDRTGCQDYIRACGFPLPMPSSCCYCHFASNDFELLWLEKSFPERFEEWAELEDKKIRANTDHPRNVGVCGKIHRFGEKKGQAVTLYDALALAKIKYPDVDMEYLQRKKWTRGNCTKSKY